MKLFVGLGNPGEEYNYTRHNIGFDTLRAFSNLIEKESNITLSWKNKFQAIYSEAKVFDEKVILLLPQTYMNLSGASVLEAAKFFKITQTDIIVAHDEMDLPFSQIKIKQGGRAAGHNGIKSIVSLVGENFFHIKMGIGRNKLIDAASYVLGRFTKEELEEYDSFLEKGAEALLYFLKYGAIKSMNKFNTK